MPRSTSGVTGRNLKSLAKPYESFAASFASGDSDLFRQEIEMTAETFGSDGNSGLAAQCIEAFRRMQIVALRDTYVTLGVDEISQKKFDVTGRGGDAGSREETERAILGMVSLMVECKNGRLLTEWFRLSEAKSGRRSRRRRPTPRYTLTQTRLRRRPIWLHSKRKSNGS